MVSLNKALLNPYFWGGTLGGGRLTSHDSSPCFPPQNSGVAPEATHSEEGTGGTFLSTKLAASWKLGSMFSTVIEKYMAYPPWN